MGGQAVRGSGRLLVPVSALSSESGPEVHEAVVRADACDEVSRRPHVPPVRGCVHLVESFLVLEDVLPGAGSHAVDQGLVDGLSGPADAHAVLMMSQNVPARCPRQDRARGCHILWHSEPQRHTMGTSAWSPRSCVSVLPAPPNERNKASSGAGLCCGIVPL